MPCPWSQFHRSFSIPISHLSFPFYLPFLHCAVPLLSLSILPFSLSPHSTLLSLSPFYPSLSPFYACLVSLPLHSFVPRFSMPILRLSFLTPSPFYHSHSTPVHSHSTPVHSLFHSSPFLHHRELLPTSHRALVNVFLSKWQSARDCFDAALNMDPNNMMVRCSPT